MDGTFDARFDTPLDNQNIVNGPLVKGDLGVDNAHVVVPQDIWRSAFYRRMNSVDPLVKMPPLARNVVDTEAVAVLAAWINGLPGVPALPPPDIAPAGGSFVGAASVSISDADTAAIIRYTLDGTSPTADSSPYSQPLTVASSLTLKARAFRTGYNDSINASAIFTIQPGVILSDFGFTSVAFHLNVNGTAGRTYVFQTSSDLLDWTPISTNISPSNVFQWIDPGSVDPYKFYRVIQQP